MHKAYSQVPSLISLPYFSRASDGDEINTRDKGMYLYCNWNEFRVERTLNGFYDWEGLKFCWDFLNYPLFRCFVISYIQTEHICWFCKIQRTRITSASSL